MRTKKLLSGIMVAAMVITAPTLTTNFAFAEDSQMGTPPGDSGSSMGGAPGSSSSSDISWAGATEITSATTTSGQTYTSTTADQNALLINTSDAVTITNPTVTKSGDSDGGDNCNFYGINSGVLVKGGSTTTITGGTFEATAKGANGVFSYGGNGGTNGAAGDGTKVVISDATITTTGDNGGGIMTTGGGEMVASNLNVTTSGQSSAAIRTDRGGGTVSVTGGTYTSNGQGSPAIYSTADISVSGATLVSTKSEGVCIEGQNSIALTNCNLTATNNALNGNAQFYDTIMIYQSQSGDAADGTSSFSMTGGTLTSNKGDVFHVTNTTAIITLNGATIYNNDSDNVLLSVCDDGWSGASNIATLNATNQTMCGVLQVGSDSTLNLNLAGTTVYTGKTDGNITNDKSTSISTSLGTVNVTMSDTAGWKLTGDCTVSSISGTGTIDYNGHTLTVGSTAYTSGSPGGSIVEGTLTGSETSTGGNTTATTTTTTTTTATSSATTATTSATSLKAVTFKNVNKTVKEKKLQKKAVSYSIIKESDGGKVTYKVKSGNKKSVKVSKKGKVTVKKGTKKGMIKLKVTVAKKGDYKKTSKVIKVKVK
ncbi:MAG: hypothetical protein K6G11_02790 [Lachnospiraceae bacterium]|nr:hypothetical protein [Lachnospiraceae bacterium]